MVDARYTTADASSVLWTHPVDCTVSPTATATAVQFTCPKEGVHAFTVTPDGDSARTDTFYVSAMRRTACYQWYFIAVPDETLFDIAGTAVSAGVANVVPAHTAGLKARLWVVDPLMPPSADEQNGVATKPSVV